MSRQQARATPSIKLSVKYMSDQDDQIKEYEQYITPNSRGLITYKDIKKATCDVLQKAGCLYLFLLVKNNFGNSDRVAITKTWRISLEDMKKVGAFNERKMYGCLCILAKTQYQMTIYNFQKNDYLEKQHMKSKLFLDSLQEQLIYAKQKIQELQTQKVCLKAQLDLLKTKPLQKGKNLQKSYIRNQQIDILILFSEPLYDVSNEAPVPPPVSYESDIQKIEQAIKKNQITHITIKKEIANLANLKQNLSKHKPRILHIICHGNQKGNLQFEESSIHKRGIVDFLTPERLKQELRQISELPQLVFLTACYSEKIGKAFVELGVKKVICIDQYKPIAQYVCQTFSQTFYSYLFMGNSIQKSFDQAKKKSIDPKNNKKLQCCCHHNHSHKKACQQRPSFQLHKRYHIPDPQKCKCDSQTNGNLHNYNCQWALQSLAALNKKNYSILLGGNKYRVLNFQELKQKKLLDKNNKFMVCCCSTINNQNLYEDNKFKMLPFTFGKNQAFFVSNISESGHNRFEDISAKQIIRRWKDMSNIRYREQKLYNFLDYIHKSKRNIFCISGEKGCGKTSFVKKAVNYQYVRKQIEKKEYVDLFNIKSLENFKQCIKTILSKIYKNNLFGNVNQQEDSQREQNNNKLSLIILDNCDNIFLQQKESFTKQLEELTSRKTNCKFYLIFEKQTVDRNLDHSLFKEMIKIQKIRSQGARDLIYDQLADILESNISKSVFSNSLKFAEQLLLYPKILKILCQLAREESEKRKMKLSVDTIQQIFNNYKVNTSLDTVIQYNYLSLINEPLNKKFALEKLLIFLANFQSSLSFETLEQLGDFNQGRDQQLKDSIIPISKDWKNQLKPLFITGVKIQQNKVFSEKESYFLAPLKNQIGLKSHVRHYLIRSKLQNFNFENIFGFIAYLSSLLEQFFRHQRSLENYQQKLISGKSLYGTGIQSLSSSIQSQYVKEHQTLGKTAQFAKQIFLQFRNVFGKDTVNISAQSILNNHKQDLMNVYNFDWIRFKTSVGFLQKKRKQVFLCYLYNLLVYIPCFFYQINDNPEFVLKKINDSVQIINTTSIDNERSNLNSIIKLKLNVMRYFVQIRLFRSENHLLKFSSQFLQCKDGLWADILKVEQMMLELRFYEERYSQLLDVKQKISEYQTIKNKMQKNYSNEENQLKKTQNFVKFKDKTIIYKQGIHIPLHRYFILLTKIALKRQEDKNVAFTSSENKTTLYKLYDLLKQVFGQLQGTNLGKQAGIVLVKIQLKLSHKLQDIHKSFLKLPKSKDIRINQLEKAVKQRAWRQAENTIIFMEATPICHIEVDKTVTSINKNLVQRSNLKKQVLNLSEKNSQQKSQIKQITDVPMSLWKKSTLVQSGNISLKHKLLNQENLRCNLLKCSLLVIQSSATVIDQDVKLIIVNDCMEQCFVSVDENLIPTLKQIQILILVGQYMTKVAQKLKLLKDKPKVIIGINTIDKNLEQNQTNVGLKYIKKLFQAISKKALKEINSIKSIHDDLLGQLHINQNQTEFIFQEEGSIDIDFSKKQFNDLSHYTRCSNNLQNENKEKKIKRVKPLNLCLNLLKQSHAKNPIWINIFGKKYVGKTQFVKQLGKIIMEAEPKLQAAFLMDGKMVQDPYSGNFYSYLENQFQMKNLIEAKELLKYRKFTETYVAIDDFQAVIPDDNYDRFINELRRSRAKVILVSETPLNPNLFLKVKIKNIEISKITCEQIDILAHFIIQKWNQQIRQEIARIKNKSQFDIRDLYDLKSLEQQSPDESQSFGQGHQTQQQIPEYSEAFYLDLDQDDE